MIQDYTFEVDKWFVLAETEQHGKLDAGLHLGIKLEPEWYDTEESYINRLNELNITLEEDASN
jgi:hypothetical protein